MARGRGCGAFEQRERAHGSRACLDRCSKQAIRRARVCDKLCGRLAVPVRRAGGGLPLEAQIFSDHSIGTNCSSASPPVVVKEQPCDAETCQSRYDRRRVMSTARSFKRVWPAGRPRPGRSKQRRADLLSLQPAHPGCCGACLTSRSRHREPERASSSHRSRVLSDAKQRLGVLWHTLSPSQSGIRDEPI